MKRSILFALAAIAFCTVTVQNASAQSDFGFKKLGVAVGFVDPEGLDGTVSIGGLADLGTIAPKFGLEAHADYWSQSEEAFGAEASVSDFQIGMRGKYLFPVNNPKIQPFAGTGLGIHFVSAEVSIPTFPGEPGMSVEDSSTELGLELGGGMHTNLGPSTDLRTEMWFGFGSDVDQFNLRVGMAWKI